MTRIDPNIRKPPAASETKAKPTRISKQKRERMNRDQEYNACCEIYKDENQACIRCGMSLPLQTHHIVGGVAGRAASLLNFDTWANVCSDCHEKQWPLEEQVVAKVLHVVRTIERLRAQNLSTEQCKYIRTRLSKEIR